MEVMLKNVRIAFCQTLLGEAEDYQGNGVFRHSATFLIEPGSANDKAVKDAIKTEAVNVWAKKADSMLESLKGNSNKYCYQNGNTKDYDGFEGKMFIGAHRKKADGRPMLLDSVKDPETGKAAKLTGAEGRIYAGCYVNAKISIYCQAGQNSGVRAGLLGVQFAGPGDSFGGAGRAKETDFDAIDAEETDDLA
jgi:hypothetical protein